MSSILVHNIKYLLTMEKPHQLKKNMAIRIEGHEIVEVGTERELKTRADLKIKADRHLVLPGFVNTHHHFYQTLFRNMPHVQNAELFEWLKQSYLVWGRIDDEALRVSTATAIAELLLSGCTTTSDLFYIFPEGKKLSIESQIKVARKLGVRFHPCRGSMSLGESRGGLPPDSLVEEEKDILRDSKHLIEKWHEKERYAMVRIVLAPCSPFSVTTELLKETKKLADRYGVYCHTHIAETLDEEKFCLEKFGKRPIEYMEETGFIGRNVWYAHCVHLSDEDIQKLAETGTGVAHCPTSNMRLGSGIAPVRKMLDAGVNVSLAVDGSGSNDSSHMLAELRQALLLQRLKYGASGLSAIEVIEMATAGGAKVLGRDDIGKIAPGMAADIVGFDLQRIFYAGAHSDPVAALVFCASQNVDFSIVNGKILVKDGKLLSGDERKIFERHERVAKRLLKKVYAHNN
ncbi:MAG: 8-oxoguanine deaminase [Thermoplasmata archaeon]